MRTEVKFYQNIYKLKNGQFKLSERLWDSFDGAKTGIGLGAKNGEYVGTIELKPTKLV